MPPSLRAGPSAAPCLTTPAPGSIPAVNLPRSLRYRAIRRRHLFAAGLLSAPFLILPASYFRSPAWRSRSCSAWISC